MVRYAHPEMFFLFIPFALLLIWTIFQNKKLNQKVDAIATEGVRRFLFNRVLFQKLRQKQLLFYVGTFFLILSSVGPQVGTKLQEIKRKGIDIMFAVDVSQSMDAEDVKPSRIEKAKYEINRFLNQLEGDRVGLIVFSGSAHLHTPLTTDYGAVRLFLKTVDTKLVGSPGSDLSSALKLAVENVNENQEKYRIVVLVSDGEDHIETLHSAIASAKKKGIVVHTIGVGTPAGSPIPIYDRNGNRTEFKKDKQGNVVTSTLNENTLTEIARETGGQYIRIANQSYAIEPLVDEIANMNKRDIKATMVLQFEDRYQVFLLLGLIFILLEGLIGSRRNKELSWEGRFTK